MNIGAAMRMIKIRIRDLWQAWAILLVATVGLLGGCTTGPNKADPWEQNNRSFYDFNEGLDKVLFKPVSDGYVVVVPKEARNGLHNAFENLGYFNVILNDFLQGKWEQGWSDSGRMAVNSTIGIAGIFDVAVHWGMPSHENDFGITMGKWGAEPGPYIVLPFFGPSCGRDLTVLPVEIVTDPTTWVAPFGAQVGLFWAEAIDARSNAEMALRLRNQAALDPYAFTRNAYLQYRDAQIHEGKTSQQQNDIYEEEEEPTTQPTTQPGAPTTQAAK
jgi:phospholipid-binding lipoprotein MlaA